jgi:hypothetical protein
MEDLDKKMKAVFGAGPRPVAVPAPKVEEKPPAIKIPPAPMRGFKDISIAIQAQRIYNPNNPPAPPTKPPSSAMLEQGTTPAMDLDKSFLGKK